MGDWEDFPTGSKPAEGYFALPEGGEGPGILLVHAWWGLNPFFTDLADRLAAEGFRVLAPDLFNGQVAETVEEATLLRDGLETDTVHQILSGAANELKGKSGDKLGLVGFSLGAYYGLWLADERPADFGAVVLFYGARDARLANREAAFQIHYAETDPYVSSDDLQALEAGLQSTDRHAESHSYPGTSQWFFEEDRKEAYNSEAAKLAWERTVAFLRENLGNVKSNA